LPHQAPLLPIGNTFVELTTVDSTNNYAMGLVQKGFARHGAVFFAYNQTEGKGQRGKSWLSLPGENLILSVVLQPAILMPHHTFSLSAAIAMACYDLFKKYAGQQVKIKWPNDIYWRDRKAGGILIENIMGNDFWHYAIVGIGMNINQTQFSENLIRPISLKQITGHSYHLTELAKELCVLLETHYQNLLTDQGKIFEYYNNNLYKINEPIRLKKKNIVFDTILKGVSIEGKLITNDKMEREFNFGEVEWIL